MRNPMAALLMICAASAAWALSPHRPLPSDDAAKISCSLGEWTGVVDKDTKSHMPNCPNDARDLVDRALNCQHWTGEEPYDEARGHEIETALTELKCDVLSLDYDHLLRKYAKRRDVLATLEAADREYSLEF